MKYCFFVFFGLPLFALGQTNQLLKTELDSMYILDQRYREYMARVDEEKPLRDSLAVVLKVD